MSSYYGVVFPEFWTGRTGRELRERGGKDAQILGLYAISNRHTNMLGLYRLLIDDIAHETGLGLKGITRGLTALRDADFAQFDALSAYVWVRKMAHFRLGLRSGDALDPDDNRAKAVNRLYQALDPNPFLGEFFDVNHKTLRLKKRRESSPLVVDTGPDHKMSGLRRGFEGACKPVNRYQDQGSGSETGKSNARARVIPVETVENPKDNLRVITKLVHDTLTTGSWGIDSFDLKEEIKTRCARLHIAYDGEAVNRALDAARRSH